MLRPRFAVLSIGLFVSACTTAVSSGGTGGALPEVTTASTGVGGSSGVGGGAGQGGIGDGGTGGIGASSTGVGGSSSSSGGGGSDCWGRRVGIGQTINVTTDHAGNVIIFGFGGLSPEGGNYIQKLGPDGVLLWEKEFGGQSYRMEVRVDSEDNLIVGGAFYGEVDFGTGPMPANQHSVGIAKLDGDGNVIWSKFFLSGQVSFAPMAIDAANDIVLAGNFSKPVDFGGGMLENPFNASMFVVRFDAAGNFVWNKAWGQASAGGVAFDPQGNILLFGTFNQPVDFGGGALDPWKGWTFLAKLDGAGGHIWSKGFGHYNSVTAWLSVTSDHAGNVVIGIPTMEGSVNFGGGVLETTSVDNTALAKFDPSGKHIWSKVYSGVSMGDLAVDTAGNVVFDGEWRDPTVLGGSPLPQGVYGQPFLAKLSASGMHMASVGFNAPQWGKGADIALDPAGRVIWAGSFWTGVDLLCGALTAPENEYGYVFVAKQLF